MKYLEKIINKIKQKKHSRLLSSVDAYRLWSTFYDSQPDNVVLYLEEKLFTEMISQIVIKDKRVLDIGCGTGRHWKELLDQSPERLAGIDNSKEMLEKLSEKFPLAEVFISENNSLKDFDDSSFDIIISTLTIGHVKEIENFLVEWNRVIKSTGEIIITDFHPEAFLIGMRRKFLFDGEIIEVENYLYSLEFLKKIFAKFNWEIISVSKKVIDVDVKYLFQKQNYIDVFNKFTGTPLILGLRLIKK